MRFSLIVATLNRVQETEHLLQSLAAQKYSDFEVIIVDQNQDNRLVELVTNYRQKFPIVHLKQAKKGLSCARNVGRLQIKGEIVAFPDDDSVYPPEILAQVAQFFRTQANWDGVIARIYDLNEDKNAFEFCGGEDQSQAVDYTTAYTVGISHAMFFRASIVKNIAFDEAMGVGAGTPWESAEDVDYLFQCLDAGYSFYYNANLKVRHPSPLKKHNFHEQIRREYSYGLGNGYLLSKHDLPKSLLQSALYSGYQHTFLEITKGNLRRASYFFMWGLGSSLGYWKGLKKHKEINREIKQKI